jgi:hypothetical protein
MVGGIIVIIVSLLVKIVSLLTKPPMPSAEQFIDNTAATTSK